VSDLYPFRSHYLDLAPAAQLSTQHSALSAQLRLHYLDEGRGEPVVMLHGNPTWSFYYRNLVLALRDSYRCVVPDHIGCGLSDKPGDSQYEYSLRRRADDVESLLDHLRIRENITLALHDWGGMIGMVYATRHPERIKRIVILNTAAFRLSSGKHLPWSLSLFRNTPLGPFLVRGLNAFCCGAAHYCVTRPMPKEVRAAYLAPYDSWRNRIAVLRFVQDIPLRPGDRSYDLILEVENNLTRLENIPMLICWGEKDFVFDEHFLVEWQKRFPKAEVHRFPDAGHYVLEDVGEEIGPLLRHFLARHSIA
jgi:haloalkane dehalogenase